MRRWIWRLLGKEGEAIVLHFASGPEPRVRAMFAEIHALLPEREHLVVCLGQPLDGLPCLAVTDAADLRRQLGSRRVGLAPFLLGDHPLVHMAFRLAPRRLLAFNARGERHQLSLRAPIASWLFWRGVELDRIWMRPSWWPWARERSRQSHQSLTLSGRALSGRPRVAIVSPYYPWPLGHGGAVRIYSMLREAAREFDLFLYCFAEPGAEKNPGPVLDFVHQAVLYEMPYYREPRWSSLLPPEVREFRSDALRERLQVDRAVHGFALIQAEYTQLAPYTSDVLVEHDVTFDLYRQIWHKQKSFAAWWNYWRWLRFERAAVRRMRRVVVMAAKDSQQLDIPHARVLPNGVDLARFSPTPEPPGFRLLFVGSFRHFPNVTAFRFFYEEVWPEVRRRVPHAVLEIVAGPDHLRYWPETPPSGDGVEIHGFVADVVPLYERANVVLSPTLVSAGTNLKVLEAMAMERAVVSTTSGCAGLRLQHGESVWIGDGPQAFAQGVVTLAGDPSRRRGIAVAARHIAAQHFDWSAIGKEQAALWREL
ncbi:MAG TPA: glycosyltransferase [Bryobacteraceae bacterium]|nr:glycosyltransferase [Bryobacteraceae bacterium]